MKGHKAAIACMGLQVKITWTCCNELNDILWHFIVRIFSVSIRHTLCFVELHFCCSRPVCFFMHFIFLFVRLCIWSVSWWSVYLNCFPCTCTSSRHAYFLCTWMAISAGLPITIIYIKFEINFTLFFPL